MSWFNLSVSADRAPRRAMLGGAVLVLGSLALSGCQIRPLYGTANTPLVSPDGETVTVQQKLAEVNVEVAGSIGRTGHVLRNELQYNLRGGPKGLPSKYRLEIQADKQRTDVGVEALADVPTAYNLTLNTSFVLSDIASGRTLYTGRSYAQASFDFSNQRFANLRAERDAENRAANVVAADIHARLAGFFATNPVQ